MLECIAIDKEKVTVIFHEDCGPVIVEKYKTPTEKFRTRNFWLKAIEKFPPLVLRDIYTGKTVFIGVRQR